jgi:hypothetical protein
MASTTHLSEEFKDTSARKENRPKSRAAAAARWILYRAPLVAFTPDERKKARRRRLIAGP